MAGYVGNIPVPQGTQTRQQFTATASQTSFATIGYTAGFVDVYLNGVKLLDTVDYAATNGSDVVLTTGAALNDILEVTIFDTFSTAGTTFTNPTFTDTATVSGDTTASVTLKNNTEEDTDGGRESTLIFKGEQSGGEISTLAEIEAAHDGSSDDEKGELILRVNDGNDGTSPSEVMRIDSLGNVGIGTNTIDVSTQAGGSGYQALQIESDEGGQLNFDHNDAGTGSTLGQINFQRAGEVVAEIEGVTDGATDNGRLAFRTQPDGGALTEAMRIDHDGNLNIGSTSNVGYGPLQIGSTSTSPTILQMVGSTSSNNAIHFADGTTGDDRYRGFVQYGHADNALLFGTNAAERMRITSGGALLVGTTSDPSTNERIRMGVTSGSKNGIAASATDTNGGTALVCFKSAGTSVGSVSFNNNNTSFNTSSDYRLKENVTNVSDGITRVKQLAPKRFNWIDDDSNTVVDGFLAHEVQTVVPEAITGAKDAMTKAVLYVDGDELPEGKEVGDVKTASTIDPQNIDQSKLVPLLAAALQEAIAKIETLETKVAALEAE